MGRVSFERCVIIFVLTFIFPFFVNSDERTCKQEERLKKYPSLLVALNIKQLLAQVFQMAKEAGPLWSEAHPKGKNAPEFLVASELGEEPVEFKPGGHLGRLNGKGWMDDILSRSDGRYQTFGPNGKRLDMRRLDSKRLGLAGDFGYIHRAGGDLFRVILKIDGRDISPELVSLIWKPSMLIASYRAGSLLIEEKKWISYDDVGYSLIWVENKSGEAVSISISTESPILGGLSKKTIKIFGLTVDVFLSSWYKGEQKNKFEIKLEPYEKIELRSAIGFSLKDENSAKEKVLRWLSAKDVDKVQENEYLSWYSENCVYFDCPEPVFKRLWYYRYYLLRRNMVLAEAGCLRHPCFYEGIYDRSPSAWRHWFDKVITFSSPHIISEARWLKNPEYAFGQVRTQIDSQAGDGIYYCATLQGIYATLYTDWIASTALDAFLVHPDKGFLREIVPSLEENVKGLLKKFDKDKDYLLRAPNFAATGMEWQPSFWYFHDYDNARNPTTLEHPAFSSYLFANLTSLALALDELGREEDAKKYREIAEKVRDAVLNKMWSDEDGFFYSIREKDDAKAKVKEIVGFYPFTFRLVPEGKSRYLLGLSALVDKDEFWHSWPLATVSKKCPAYTPRIQSWPAKGGVTTSCMWNGPTWPHSNSLIAMAMANDLRFYHSGYIKLSDFYRFLELFSWLHYEDEKAEKPLLLEYYDGETSAGYGCLDYLHSTYIDLLIQYGAGLIPRSDDKIELFPLIRNWDYFAFDDIHYHGHNLTIVWQKENVKRYKGIRAGLSLYVDGVLVFNQPSLGHYLIEPEKQSFEPLPDVSESP